MTLSTLTAVDVAADLNRDGQSILIDVRTPVEFATVHASGARNIPLDRLDPAALDDATGSKRIYLICKSGSRAATACRRLSEAGWSNAVAVEGGIEAWMRQNLPVERRAVMSLERQVQIAVGSMVVLGVALGVTLSPWWLLLPAFVGSGLVFAGISNFCGLALLLARAPWNRYDGNEANGPCGSTSCSVQ